MRSNLELLLLSLVRDGLGTPYELKMRADISLGSTVPALARLESDGLIKASEPEARRSRRFTITAKGIRALENEWRDHLNTSVTDIDSVLRIAYLAWIYGAHEQSAAFLERSATRMGGLATMASAEASRSRPIADHLNNEAIRWLRARLSRARMEAEAKELRSLAVDLQDLNKTRKKKNKKNKPTIRPKS